MKEIKITPLGTVSPYPKGIHNCPGFLIEYEEEKILLDCGNGSTSLLNFPNDLKNLHIFITHYHKDHLGDLSALQYASFVYHNLGLLEEKIKIYLPEKDFQYTKLAIMETKESYSEYIEINDNTRINIKNLIINIKDNKSHSISSFMIKLQNKDFKIIYTSDIGPTHLNELKKFCQNADLIICESSFLKKHNASNKTHLTAHDAAMIAKYANAKKLVLTHFWPEEDTKLYLDEALEFFENTIISAEGKPLILRRKQNE